MIAGHCARSDSSQFLLPLQGSVLQNRDHVVWECAHSVLHWSLAHNCRENQNDRIILWPCKRSVQNFWNDLRISQHIVTAHFVPADKQGLDTDSFVYSLHWSSLWVKISALAYKANTLCWPERLSVAYCTHIIQTKLMLKNRRYPQKSMFIATGRHTDVPLVVLGNL